MSKFYIVVFDDQQGIACPMGFDPDCDGAICWTDGAVALFASRSDARRAIRISTAFARLNKSRGVPYNSDFIEAIKCVTVLPAVTK